MKKEKIKNIVLIMVVAVISSTITSFATSNYLFDSVDVKYNNSNGVQAETVQGAIDELYSCASDYSSVNNKIDGYFQNNPTSVFDGDQLQVNKNGSTAGGIALYGNNGLKLGVIAPSGADGLVVAGWKNNTYAQGKLELIGNPVKINGTDIGNYFMITRTAFATTTKATIPSHGGGTFSNLLTTMPSVSVPSGYTLVSHVYMELSGIAGVSCVFDALNNATKTSSINGFIFNSGNTTANSGTSVNINIISLWKKS